MSFGPPPAAKKSWHKQAKRSSASARTLDGIVFDSLKEKNRWAALRLREQVGEIRNLRRQVRHDLILPDGAPIKIGKRTCVYTSDFEYDLLIARGMGNDFSSFHIVEDVKGFRDRESKFRIAVFEAITGQTVTIIT